jgi:tetratricopeptide (TPR) repeat protein
MEQSEPEKTPEGGQSAQEKRDANEVISELRAAIQLAPDDAALHEKLAHALLEQGDADAAANEFKEAIRLSCDDDAWIHNSLGTALEEAGKIQEAVQEYQHAVRLEPEECLWHWYLSDALMKQGDTHGAIKGYQQAILLGCDHEWVHKGLGDAHKAKGDLDAAIAEYTQAAELLPGEAQFRSDLAGAWTEKGDLFVRQGRWKDALAEYRRADELGEDVLVDARDGLAEQLQEHCSALAKEGKSDEAISECREVLSLDPENANVHVLLGNLLARCGKVEEAFAKYHAANLLNPDIDAHDLLDSAIAKRREGLSNKACLAECEAGLRVDPENWKLGLARMMFSGLVAGEHYRMGLDLEQFGYLDGAIAEYIKALSLSRQHHETRYALGRALLRNGDPMGAFSELFQAVVKGPWGKTLAQYALLLVGITILAWSLV